MELYFAGKKTLIRTMICSEISKQQKLRFFHLMSRPSAIVGINERRTLATLLIRRQKFGDEL